MWLVMAVLSLLGTLRPFWAGSDPRDLLPPAGDGSYYFSSATDSRAADTNDGSRERPFRTIGRGVTALQPGDTLWVRAGDYREYVRVDKSGLGPEGMLAVRAMPGEQVTVRGSELLTGWQRADSERDRPIWEIGAILNNVAEGGRTVPPLL